MSQKEDTTLLSTPLLSIDRFLKFFHLHIQREIYKKVIAKDFGTA